MHQKKFLSTPSARRATFCHPFQLFVQVISIHALREEGDLKTLPPNKAEKYFYPRPPRGGRPLTTKASVDSLTDFYPRPPRGGRRCKCYQSRSKALFLSTPSARRATCCVIFSSLKFSDFYPRPPRGGRLIPVFVIRPIAAISIHALREEGDVFASSMFSASIIFLSTPSARRATLERLPLPELLEISIHALREEGDYRVCCLSDVV